MTALYGSQAVPKRVFGEGRLLDTFYHTLRSQLPGAWALNELYLDIWDDNALEYNWVLPDNFHVHIKVMDSVTDMVSYGGHIYKTNHYQNLPVREGRSLGANINHSIDGMVVRELTRRCDYDPLRVQEIQEYLNSDIPYPVSKTKDDRIVKILADHYRKTNYLSARIIDHLTLSNIGYLPKKEVQKLIDSLPEKPFKVVSIHDCFRCLPHYGNDLRMQYNIQLALLAQSNLLQELLYQVTGNNIQVNKLDILNPIEANYALS